MSGIKEGAKRVVNRISAALARGHRFEGAPTFRVLTGPNVGLLFTTDNPEQNYASGLYERSVTGAIQSALKPGDTFYDVGANNGWFTLLAARRVGPKGNVFAFEPGERNARLLGHNIAQNKFEDRVTIVEKAIADLGGSLEFAEYGNCGLVNRLVADGYQPESDAKIQQVPVITIDSFSQHNPAPNGIKIDIEGGELRAIKGARGTLEAHRPFVVCEIRDDLLKPILQIMNPLGYRARDLGGNSRGDGFGLRDIIFKID